MYMRLIRRDDRERLGLGPDGLRPPRPTGVIQSADLTAPTVSGLCLGIGVTTVGVGALVCGVLVVGSGFLAEGVTLGMVGEDAGELIYEIVE